jgi:hypothetical protein
MRTVCQLFLAAGGVVLLLAVGSCGRLSVKSTASPRTVTLAQSGSADVIGSDGAALQKAVELLKPGDTLSIGPGTYYVENLRMPPRVMVRGADEQTILKK